MLSIAAASNHAHGIVDSVLNAKVWTHTGHHDGSANMSRLIFLPLLDLVLSKAHADWIQKTAMS